MTMTTTMKRMKRMTMKRPRRTRRTTTAKRARDESPVRRIEVGCVGHRRDCEACASRRSEATQVGESSTTRVHRARLSSSPVLAPQTRAFGADAPIRFAAPSRVAAHCVRACPSPSTHVRTRPVARAPSLPCRRASMGQKRTRSPRRLMALEEEGPMTSPRTRTGTKTPWTRSSSMRSAPFSHVAPWIQARPLPTEPGTAAAEPLPRTEARPLRRAFGPGTVLDGPARDCTHRLPAEHGCGQTA
jgi:hypothetical protein